MDEIAFESTTTMTQRQFAEWVRARPRGDLNDYELLNGRVVMNPPAGFPHGRLGSELQFLLQAFIKPRQLGLVFDSSQGFALPSGDTLEPDISFISSVRWRAGPPPVEGEFLEIVPDLVIELLSPGTAPRARGEKKAIYERNGVGEYVLVDWRSRSFSAFLLRDGRYEALPQVGEGGSYELKTLPGLVVRLAELFA